ncbi:MAG: MCE family protein [Alphaproteobacteria bacterium]|nr:MCE family protein [Alphaproteobacteria bacterium]
MQDSRINYVMVGTFVTAMLIAFIIVISTLAGRTGATDDYYTVYDNVGGLKFGTLVMYEGYQIGQVESIEPIIEGTEAIKFRVNLSVREGWRIPDDSIARASVSGLLAAMTVDIDEGESKSFLKPGALIQGQSATNFFAALSEIGSQFGELSADSIKPLLANINAYIKNLDQVTMERVPPILADLNKISNQMAADVPEITAGLRRTTTMIEKDVLKPENRQHIDSVLANLDQTSGDLANLSGDLDETRQLLVTSMQSIAKLVDDNKGNVDESVRNLRYTLDTISRYVDDISHNTESTTRNLAEFARAIRENPGLLVSGSPQDDSAKAGK